MTNTNADPYIPIAIACISGDTVMIAKSACGEANPYITRTYSDAACTEERYHDTYRDAFNDMENRVVKAVLKSISVFKNEIDVSAAV